MSINLTVSEEEMQDDQAATLREGYIGPVDVVDFVNDDDPETFGGQDVLVFTFEALDNDHIGQQFEHIEWPITEDDLEEADANDQTNAQIQLRRLVHILSRILAVDEETVREQIVRFQGDTVSEAWDNLRNNVERAFEKFGLSQAVKTGDLHAKVFASVNSEGYVNVRFGKYPGFLRVVEEDPKLEFNQWERNQNAQAEQAMNNSPDDDTEFDFGDDEDFDDFDDDDFDADF